MTHRALIVSHAHPDFSKGGAEVAAYNLFRGVGEIPGWHAHLLARHGVPGLARSPSTFVNHAAGRETLFANETEHFTFSLSNPRRMLPAFRDFLERMRPDVVHFHHYWQVGLELLAEVKRYSSSVPVVMTLHEFLAICHQNGQMVKTNGELCRKSSAAECHACMPERGPRDYFLRKRYIESFFHYVDHFVSPSEFLRGRYIDWGIPPERISMIENGLVASGELPARNASPTEKAVVRLAFFGQINPFKGVDILIEAARHLPEALDKKVHIEIHGGGLEAQGPAFRQRFTELMADAPKFVRYYGPYSQDDLPGLMQNIDWVVVPSTWWENSPVVIQEAFKFGRPVICADIGGMAEKVRDGVSGIHFRARNALDLAHRIEQVVTDRSLWPRLHAGIARPPTLQDAARQHVALYEPLISSRASVEIEQAI
jgi:glycosyltransferase involved in cell wall biosynthesis